jgi:hypothetical protein
MRRDGVDGVDDPTPLAVVGATDLERRLLSAAAAERPSDEMTRQMRLALGFTAVAAPVTAVAAPVSAAAATKVVAAKSISGWLAACTLAAAVTAGGGIAMWRFSGTPTPPTPPREAPAAVATPVVTAPEAPAPAVAASRVAHRRRAVAAPASNDLRDEIALVDAARASLEAGAPERALVLLRRYAASYPAGTFRPEAAVLRIESLAATGRHDEARALARDFVARHPASPLSERMARLAATP